MLPVFLLFFAATLDLGRLAFARVAVTNAAREGAMQAAQTPNGYVPGGACQPDENAANYNVVYCRIQLEAKNSGVTINPADVTVTCSVSGCPTGLGNTVQVSIVGHFTLLTPLMATFFGGSQNVNFTASATNQIETLPTPSVSGVGSSPSPSPSPSPTSSGSASPSPSPSVGTCTKPSAGFTATYTPGTRTSPVTVTVKDTSTSPNCYIDSWVWQWGDSTTTMGTSGGTYSHTFYAVNGKNKTYSIKLTVTNGAGSNTSGAYNITVKP